MAPNFSFDTDSAMESAMAIQSQRYGELKFRSKNQDQVFPSYVCIGILAEQAECKKVLEIGAGWSTAVLADFALRNGAEVCTVDADLSRMKSYFGGTRHEAVVSSHVELIEGATIGSDELIDFYSDEPKAIYADVNSADILHHIDVFQSPNCSLRRRYNIRKIAGRNWSARKMMSHDSSLVLKRPLLNLYSAKGDFDNEIAFLRDVESRGNAGLIDNSALGETCWDLIFFDSGELASMIEWTKLKSNIAVGGFAAFHDIYFPKSIKNIVPCAAIMADPDWQVVFRDASTRQGLLIAQRLR